VMGAVARSFRLLKAVLRLVELRGFEPLTFSLRRLRPAVKDQMPSADLGASDAC